jgi:SAM-dependent methyltransferase
VLVRTAQRLDLVATSAATCAERLEGIDKRIPERLESSVIAGVTQPPFIEVPLVAEMSYGVTSSTKAHWDRAYTDRSPVDVSWYQKEPTLSLELIRDSGVPKDAPLIDIGGGASTLVDRLWADGFSRLAVLDISATALAHAQRRIREHAGTIEWYEADVTEFSAPHPFVLWHDRATLHFLVDSEDRRRYMEVLKRSLTDHGHVIIATFAIGGPTRCSGLDIVQYDARKLSRELGDDFRLVAERSEVHITPAKTEQRFSYFHFVRIEDKKHLDERLDEALWETFPASDPPAVTPL